MMAIVSAIVSMVVVKLFAPCVVKHAMMKEFVEKQMDTVMLKSMMYQKMMMDGKMMPPKPKK